MSKKLEQELVKSLTESIEKSGLSCQTVQNTINKSVKDYISENKKELEKQILEKAEEIINIPRVITPLETVKGKEKKPKLTHKQFDDLTKVVRSGVPALMVGLPGTGKTSAAKQVAEMLGIGFQSISVGIQTTKSDILGFIDAGGSYQATGFRKAFEEGGLYLMDEIDAGNPNVLIIINSAISNGFCNFPDGMIEASPKFRFIATANTYGTGADSRFIGRNQLDEATIDRFVTVNWEIDETLEKALCTNQDWLIKVRLLRNDVKISGHNIMVSPRISIYGSMLIDSGFTINQALEMTLLKGKDDDDKEYVRRIMSIHQ